MSETKPRNAAQTELAEIRAAMEALEAREQAIYEASLAAPVAEKVCDDFFAKMFAKHEEWGGKFTWPVEVHGITYSGEAIAPVSKLEIGKCRECGRGCERPVAFVRHRAGTRRTLDRHAGRKLSGAKFGEFTKRNNLAGRSVDGADAAAFHY